jgi:hypothetical protein
MSKKYKTVGGYLRAEDERMQCRLPIDMNDVIAATKEGLHRIVDGLLLQIGLPPLDANETPHDGIARLLAIGGTDLQLKVLRDCQRWLKDYRIIMSVSTCVVTIRRSGIRSWVEAV